jgi:hypothetical protein
MEALEHKACNWLTIVGFIAMILAMVWLSGCSTIAGGVKGAGMGAWEDLQNANRWVQEEH